MKRVVGRVVKAVLPTALLVFTLLLVHMFLAWCAIVSAPAAGLSFPTKANELFATRPVDI